MYKGKPPNRAGIAGFPIPRNYMSQPGFYEEEHRIESTSSFRRGPESSRPFRHKLSCPGEAPLTNENGLDPCLVVRPASPELNRWAFKELSKFVTVACPSTVRICGLNAAHHERVQAGSSRACHRTLIYLQSRAEVAEKLTSLGFGESRTPPCWLPPAPRPTKITFLLSLRAERGVSCLVVEQVRDS